MDAQNEAQRMLRDKQVRERTGLSRTTRWRMVKAGRFPAPVELTPGLVGWREADIVAWLAKLKPPTWAAPSEAA